ncbi:MAG: hypothetical protein H7X86_00585 [Gorillibacterium sp.]|nr:hypothetical protein [Gorillibacterium sp.]
MLRFMFGQENRTDSGLLAEAIELMNRFVKLHTTNKLASKRSSRDIRLALLTRGLLRSLDELEQSIYVCVCYKEQLKSRFMEDLEVGERNDYHRHIYFYKNALIRIFSILDKLGGFLNVEFSLETQKEKENFSYFTVLRRMKIRSAGVPLEKMLFDFKIKYQEPMLRLKVVRNLEVHAMNEELADDLARLLHTGPTPIEDISSKLNDLAQGYEMVCRVLITVFRYLEKVNRQGSTSR